MSTTLSDGAWMCCHNPLVVTDPADDTQRCVTCGAVTKWAADGSLVILREAFVGH